MFSTKLNGALAGKVNQVNCGIIYTYIVGGGIGGGNAYEIYLDDYVKFNIGPLSNDYNAWKPSCNLYISIRNKATGEWSGWKSLGYVYPFL